MRFWEQPRPAESFGEARGSSPVPGEFGKEPFIVSNVCEVDISNETGRNVAGDESPVGSWGSVLYLARKEVCKNRRSHLVAVAAALMLGIAAAFMFGVISGSPSGSSLVTTALNIVFVLFIAALPRTGAWPSDDLSTGRGISSSHHIAFLKTLPLTFGQIVAARTLVAVFSVVLLLTVFLGSFYALSRPLRDGLGVGEFFLFAAFCIGVSLAFEAIGLFTELNTRGLAGFWVYLVLGALSGGVVGGYGAIGVNVVAWVIELIQSRGAFLGAAVLLLGGILLAISCLATTRRLNSRGVGS